MRTLLIIIILSLSACHSRKNEIRDNSAQIAFTHENILNDSLTKHLSLIGNLRIDSPEITVELDSSATPRRIRIRASRINRHDSIHHTTTIRTTTHTTDSLETSHHSQHETRPAQPGSVLKWIPAIIAMLTILALIQRRR
ncbi:MAG: hypothetical protein K2L80_03790 [Muribaculaceae bacterium]|nr:hypothetical protein [Muribaculaceae bacterium]